MLQFYPLISIAEESIIIPESYFNHKYFIIYVNRKMKTRNKDGKESCLVLDIKSKVNMDRNLSKHWNLQNQGDAFDVSVLYRMYQEYSEKLDVPDIDDSFEDGTALCHGFPIASLRKDSLAGM